MELINILKSDNKFEDAILFLIDKGIDVNAIDQNDRTILMIALQYKSSENIIKLLIEKGPDVNAIDKYGQTILMYALQFYPSDNIIKLLIGKGADFNAIDKCGITILMFALIFHLSEEIIELLIEKGANVNGKYNSNKSILMYALENKCSKKIIELLIENGADVNNIMSFEYYNTLEIPAKSSIREVKIAYKNLSFKHHPDKGGDEKTFQKISNAYNILSNQEKKRQYDINGEDGNGINHQQHHQDDIFKHFFGGRSPFEEQQTQKCNDINHTLKISLEEAYTGIKKLMKIKIQMHCLNCTIECDPCRVYLFKTFEPLSRM